MSPKQGNLRKSLTPMLQLHLQDSFSEGSSVPRGACHVANGVSSIPPWLEPLPDGVEEPAVPSQTHPTYSAFSGSRPEQTSVSESSRLWECRGGYFNLQSRASTHLIFHEVPFPWTPISVLLHPPSCPCSPLLGVPSPAFSFSLQWRHQPPHRTGAVLRSFSDPTPQSPARCPLMGGGGDIGKWGGGFGSVTRTGHNFGIQCLRARDAKPPAMVRMVLFHLKCQ